MSVRSFLVRLTVKAAAVAALAWSGATASAADVTPPPVTRAAPVYADPVTVGAGCPTGGCSTAAGCESCQHGAIRAKCDVCGKLLGSHLKKDKKAPYPVTLCPGACFGYFQTQWRKWDEVCPYPYTGTGVSDAARIPAASVNPPRTGTGLDSPRPVEPKTMPEPKKIELPAIPMAPEPKVPGNKFGP